MEKFEDFLDILPNTRETSFYMWGTGNTAQMYHEGIAREEGITIEGYIDNNPEKWERMFLGKQVLSPRKYHGNSDGPVLICTAQNAVLHAVREQISLGGGQATQWMSGFFLVIKRNCVKSISRWRMTNPRRYFCRFCCIA